MIQLYELQVEVTDPCMLGGLCVSVPKSPHLRISLQA